MLRAGALALAAAFVCAAPADGAYPGRNGRVAYVESALGRIAGASASDESLAAAMQAALWPATWGYYLAQFTSVDDAGRRPIPRVAQAAHDRHGHADARP